MVGSGPVGVLGGDRNLGVKTPSPPSETEGRPGPADGTRVHRRGREHRARPLVGM